MKPPALPPVITSRRGSATAIVAPGWVVGRPVHVVFHTRPSQFNEGAERLRGQAEFRGLRRDSMSDEERAAFTNGGVALADPVVVIEEEVPARSYLNAVVLLGIAGVMLALLVLLLPRKRGGP